MSRAAETTAVAVLELRTLCDALPQLIGADHPQLDVLEGALEDVCGALFTALVGGTDGGVRAVAVTQHAALRSIAQLITELPDPARDAPTTGEALEIVCGLLDIVCAAR